MVTAPLARDARSRLARLRTLLRLIPYQPPPARRASLAEAARLLEAHCAALDARPGMRADRLRYRAQLARVRVRLAHLPPG